jgi:hypothetical protein
MEATPFEQVVVADVATKETGDVTVAPLLGLVTVTVANAGAANDKSTQAMVRMDLITSPSLFPVGMRNQTKAGRGARTALYSGRSNGDTSGE